MSHADQPTRLYHKLLGECTLEGTEGVVWVIRRAADQNKYRIPPTRRREFTRIERPQPELSKPAPVPSDKTPRTDTSRIADAPPHSIVQPAPLGPTVSRPLPTTPEEIRRTLPDLWIDLEGWIKQREELDNRHKVFCRRVLISCLAGRCLSTQVAYDAGRLLNYALRRGFRSKHLMTIRALSIREGEPSVDSVSAATWRAMAAWGRRTQELSVQERELCESFAQHLERDPRIGQAFGAAAAMILAKATANGFDRRLGAEDIELRDVPHGDTNVTSEAATSQPACDGGSDTDSGIVIVRNSRDDVGVEQADPRWLRRVIESIRTGLPPCDGWGRSLTIGFESLSRRSTRFLAQVDQHGSGLVIRGGYGQGKTFLLNLVADLALEAGFAVAQAEVDASENRLDRPDQIYRSLMASLRVPNMQGMGAEQLATRTMETLGVVQRTERASSSNVQYRRKWLESRIGCRPIEWLFADPGCLDKHNLMALLRGDKSVTANVARSSHVLSGTIQDWPTFSYGTQGDIGSYLLAGLGRLCRLVQFKGLILLFDEMERWQDLDFRAQARAGNLLGGLIWGATAPRGVRQCRKNVDNTFFWERSFWAGCDHPSSIKHSGFGGGYPFTTAQPCHLGVAIAMTPRGDDPPEDDWRQFGALEYYDLAEFDFVSVREYLRLISPVYRRAYGLQEPVSEHVIQWAYSRWRDRGDKSARSGVAAVIESLDRWRQCVESE